MVSRPGVRPVKETVGLIIPTHVEARAVLKAFQLKREGLFYKGFIQGYPVRVCISGVGAEGARRAAGALVQEGAKILVSAGFCGALVPGLNVGDIVTERIRSVDNPAKTPEERRALTQRANAVAVDMETQAIVEEGTRRGVAIRVLRVISDEFETDLTPLLGSRPGFSAWRIGLRLLWPGTWPLAWALFRNSQLAQAALVKALSAVTWP